MLELIDFINDKMLRIFSVIIIPIMMWVNKKRVDQHKLKAKVVNLEAEVQNNKQVLEKEIKSIENNLNTFIEKHSKEDDKLYDKISDIGDDIAEMRVSIAVNEAKLDKI